MQSLAPSLVFVLVFAAVALAVVGIGPPVFARIGARRRFADTVAGSVPVVSLRQDQMQNMWSKLISVIEQRGVSLSDSNPGALRARLLAAGYSHPDAARAYVLIRVVLTLGLPAILLIFLPWLSRESSTLQVYLTAAGFALLGLYLPALWVSARAGRRQQQIINGFPDALDLMLVCVEAGLGLDAAFARVGSEVVRSHPLLAEQFGIVTLELRAGRGREEAMRRLADRAGVQEIRAFATLLIQSEKLGSSIAQTLRIYAAEMREKRRMRAEEKAHRLPVLLSIPLVCCLLPTMIGVLMLPAVLIFMRDVAPHLG